MAALCWPIRKAEGLKQKHKFRNYFKRKLILSKKISSSPSALEFYLISIQNFK